MLSMHYEKKSGGVPVTIAYGKVSLGKTQAAEAAQSVLGLSKKFRLAKVTDKQAAKLATQSTLAVNDKCANYRRRRKI